MKRIKEKALRELGDQGAETLERYFAQIEYTAFWCIRMLYKNEGIEAVIPEGFEDVVIVRRDICELHQVKTRDEGPGPWLLSSVLPIICQQYKRRIVFSSDCHFHFVSDQIADNRVQRPGSLFRLKHLLEIKHNGESHSVSEREEFSRFEAYLKQKITSILLSEYQDDIDDTTAIKLIHNTWIDTDSPFLRTPNNILELEAAFEDYSPGHLPYTYAQLQDIYDRLILFILKRTIMTKDIKSRHIYLDDVLSCRSKATSTIENGYTILDQAPGRTKLEKKVLLGGFSTTEIPLFNKQKLLAKRIKRKYESLKMEDDLEFFVTTLLEHQRECWDEICRVCVVSNSSGPRILSMLKPKLPSIILSCFPYTDINETICIGLLWEETEECVAWWHYLENSA